MQSTELSNIKLNQGLSQDQWKALEFSLENSEDPSAWIKMAKAQHPNLADRALEAGFYNLAAHLVCTTPLFQIRALVLSSQTQSAEILTKNLEEGAEKVFCEIVLGRAQGQNQKLYSQYKDQVESHFKRLRPEVEIEARLQWTQVLYALELWDDVLTQYKIAFSLAEKGNYQGYKAVTAFNISTVYENLNQKIEAKTWLWVCQKELDSYRLDHLNNSIQLYEIQCALKDLQDEKVIERAQAYLKEESLGLTQRIRALHTLAESQTEYGLIFDAEMTLSLSRKIIQQSNYEQYTQAQEILELNLASIIHRPSRFQSRKNMDRFSLQLHHKAAQARWAYKVNDHARALRLAAEIKAEAPQNEDFEDLFVLLTNRLEHPGRRARTLEHQIFKCWLSKQWKALEYIKTHLEIENSKAPWKRCLTMMIEGVLAKIQFEEEKSLQSFQQGRALAQNYGLERLETLMISLLKTLHSQKTSSNHDMSQEELAFYESLISKISAEPVAVSRNKTGQISLGIEKSDLVFDEDKSEIIWQDQAIPLHNQPILQRLLRSLLANPQGVSKETIIETVWGFEYHPLHHDQMLYSTMGRLRDLIPVEMEEGRYKIPSAIKWTYLSQNKEDSFRLSPRQKKLMEIIEAQNTLSRKEVVEALGVSERTALRELTNLVRMGLLQQIGAGRGVHYTKWNQGV